MKILPRHQTGRNVLTVLTNVQKQLKKTIILITHNQNIAKLGNRIIKLKDGKIEDIVTQKNPAQADEIEW